MTSIVNRAISGIIDAAGNQIERVRSRQGRYASLRALETVDSATLRDIGISRAELLSVCLSDPTGRKRHHV